MAVRAVQSLPWHRARLTQPALPNQRSSSGLSSLTCPAAPRYNLLRRRAGVVQWQNVSFPS